MRSWFFFFPAALLAACATTLQPEGRIEILSTALTQPLQGAQCEVETGAGRWNVATPGIVQVGEPHGDLRVVCSKEGYRASEVVFRRSSPAGMGAGTQVGVGMVGGFGGHSSMGVSLGLGFPWSSGRASYPSRVVVDMTPQQ